MANSDEVKSENALMGSGFVSLKANEDGLQTDDECLLPSLPTVEQMQRDVANATCELQRPFFQPVDKCPESGEAPAQQNSTKDSLWPDQKVPTTEDAIDGSGTSKEDPLHRTREETVSEELIINGKRYRHTYQKRTVLERQKTREVFILPASPKCPRIGGECHEEKYASSNFDNYHQAFEESGVRLELSVKNLEGSFNPMVVVVPQTDSPGTPRLRSSRRSSPKQGSPVKTIPEVGEENEESDSVFAPNSGPITVTSPDVEPRNTTTTPLVVSHMYHFGKWGKDAAILDPRLPTGLKLPAEVCGPEDSIFSVAPAEWHQSDITYGGGTAGSSGTKAKARIVACLQRFTQRSAQTGKQLYRGTYVQHTKIARWRTSSRPDEPPQSAESTPPSSADQSPMARKPPLRPPGNFPESVANVSEVWKQGARSPLGNEGEAFFPRDDTHRPRPLRACSYRRLQLLQSICPAAAAAVLILGKQMPEMRGSGISPPHTPSNFTVTADAWCPRALMLTEPDANALIFSAANSAV
uniref:Pecanex-like protein n=1 Tax=Mesocestoides corti TaxID=53468 RepID=A0A5K3FH04_MESCO